MTSIKILFGIGATLWGVGAMSGWFSSNLSAGIHTMCIGIGAMLISNWLAEQT